MSDEPAMSRLLGPCVRAAGAISAGAKEVP